MKPDSRGALYVKDMRRNNRKYQIKELIIQHYEIKHGNRGK